MRAKVVVFEPDGIYRTIIENILTKNEYRPYFVETSAECRVVVDEVRPEIIIVDIKPAKLHDFRLLSDLKVLSNAPILLTTDENVDEFMGALSDNKITIVLPKPLKSAELARVMENLLTADYRVWFGIHNYLPGLRKLRSMKLRRSTQVRTCIKTMMNEMHAWGFNFSHESEMDIVWQEILINAVYHAHGYTEEKKQRVAIELPDPYEVDVTYGASETAFGIAVRDHMGTLTPEIILKALHATIEQQQMILKAAETGEDISSIILDRGRGIDLIRQLSGEYYFIIDPGNSTEVIIIYDRYYEKDDAVGSLKIFDLSYYVGNGPSRGAGGK
jgi:DNA-binding NarL/FixJ family response regulator